MKIQFGAWQYKYSCNDPDSDLSYSYIIVRLMKMLPIR